jgi:ATP-dependent Clp protease adaptor protein ClpS
MVPPMTDIITKPSAKDEIKVDRPRLHKVILVNDDFTPREFVVMVLKAEFRMSEDQALRVMMTAHRRGACVVAVYTKDVAEAKATNATDAGRRKGYPLLSPPSLKNNPTIGVCPRPTSVHARRRQGGEH